MIRTDRLPIAWTWATIRYGRLITVPHARSSAANSAAWWPRTRRTSSVAAPSRVTRFVTGAGAAGRPRSRANPQLFRERSRRIVEGHRPVGLAANELADHWVLRLDELLGSTASEHLALR